MNRRLKNISWIVIGLAPFLFWFEMYRAWTTEYDENWGHFFLAIIISFITVGLLIFVRNDASNSSVLKRVIKLIAILLASPVTVGLIVVYLQMVPMRLVWSGGYTDKGKSYSDEKKRNFFKAENILIIDNPGERPDSLKAIVKKNGQLEMLVRINNGREIPISKAELEILTPKQRRILLEY